MSSTLSPTSASAGQKHLRDGSATSPSNPNAAGASPSASMAATASSAAGPSSSGFRNVSACNRCRLRKNRCDQNLPACSACEKAHVKCVGYDPITKREIPRSYVFYLESRVAYLESLLQSAGVPFAPPEDFAITPTTQANATGKSLANGADSARSTSKGDTNSADKDVNVDKLVSHASAVAVQGASDSRFLGSASGISFARVVFAAVKSSVSGQASERGTGSRSAHVTSAAAVGASSNVVHASKPAALPAAGNTTMRDSFFGLHTKPTIKAAPFPSHELALRLVNLYFEHANPQIPVLHRQEFRSMFERVYASDEYDRTARESYLLNIVFAIGAGIIVGKPPELEEEAGPEADPARVASDGPPSKRRKIAEEQRQPEEYHASAIVHLEAFLTSNEPSDGIGSSLEELQAVLLLAGFALLRPVAPGLWYIIGVAVRLAIDLGLHEEDGIEAVKLSEVSKGSSGTRVQAVGSTRRIHASDLRRASDPGRKQYIRDFRRRLWWCVYSFDRLVSTCVGRPFGISDHDTTTEFPSLLDDEYITPTGFDSPPEGSDSVSYKHVAYHYFRLRLLQSEILQVLQWRQVNVARERGVNQDNPYMFTNLPCPFLKAFNGSFLRWRTDIDRRLWEWKESAPAQQETGVQFSPLFLDLNYWQAVIMLYRQSLSTPADLVEDVRSATEDVTSPTMIIEEREEEDSIFLKVAEAGQKVLKLYRQLHRLYLVNYTFLATHHLFMAGIAFLYALWHSPLVRSRLTLDDVDFTILAATSVLGDLVEMCAPAGACRDAFERMSKATIKMCLATTGFGEAAQAHLGSHSRRLSESLDAAIAQAQASGLSTPKLDPNNPNFPYAPVELRKRQPQFDYDLRDLFSEEESAERPFGGIFDAMQQRPSQRPSASNAGVESIHATDTVPNPMSQSLNDFFAAPQHTVPYPSSAFAPGGTSSSGPQAFSLLSPYSDLEFLDSVSVPEALGGEGAGGGAATGLDPLDMGLGVGWDGTFPAVNAGSEWSENVDMFEGFFFGGMGNGVM